MNIWERITALFSKPEPPAHEGHVMLDEAEMRQADRLSKLVGKRRDEVLSEAYRRARLLDETESYRAGR